MQDGQSSNGTATLSTSDFDRLFQTHCAFVWRCLGALGVRGPDVEDLAQEVFVIVHRRLSDFDLNQGARPWLYGILRRVVLNHRRSQRRRPTGHSPLDEDMGATAGDQHLTLEAREAAMLIKHVLSTMPEEQAEVFLLVDVEQFSVIEVGATLDIPINTAHSRLRLARARFQAALAKRDDA